MVIKDVTWVSTGNYGTKEHGKPVKVSMGGKGLEKDGTKDRALKGYEKEDPWKEQEDGYGSGGHRT